MLIFSQFNSYSQIRIPVILDADTGNEVDDLYAISSALFEAIIHSDWAEEVIIHTSKDYGNRDINYYKVIDHQKMKEEFFDTKKNYLVN